MLLQLLFGDDAVVRVHLPRHTITWSFWFATPYIPLLAPPSLAGFSATLSFRWLSDRACEAAALPYILGCRVLYFRVSYFYRTVRERPRSRLSCRRLFFGSLGLRKFFLERVDGL